MLEALARALQLHHLMEDGVVAEQFGKRDHYMISKK